MTSGVDGETGKHRQQPPTKPAAGRRRPGPRSQVTRDALIDTGLRLFLEFGYHQTSIQQICDNAGLTKGAFYHHFEAKDEVLLLAHERYLRKQLDILSTVAKGSKTPAEALREIIRQMLVGVVEHRAELSLFLEERRSLRGSRFEDVRAMRREFEVTFVDIITAGVKAGEFRGDRSDSRVVALGLLGMISWTYQWFWPSETQTITDVADTLASTVLQGLVVRPVGE